MNNIKKVLMERDGMTAKEADELMDEVYNMMMEAIEAGNYMEAEELFMSEVGLEPDYMMELFF